MNFRTRPKNTLIVSYLISYSPCVDLLTFGTAHLLPNCPRHAICVKPARHSFGVETA
jgi:hypothetical protein